MKRTKKLSVTIGIPAYNEEQNIGNMLQSVLKQQCRTFTLKKILVVCDGSKDNTPQIVNALKKQYSIIHILNDRKRLGKVNRLNQLYRKNTGDYLLSLDADCVLETPHEIEKALAESRKTGAQVVAMHQIPVKPRGFVKRILYANHCLWTEVRIRINEGNYYDNMQGSATLLSREFTRSFRYPSGFITDGGYLYIKSSRMNTIAFSPENRILYQPLGTFRDWIRLNHRILSRRYRLKQEFGHHIPELYNPPFKAKVSGIASSFRKDPLFTLLALFMCYGFQLIKLFQKPTVSGKWPTLTSTKFAIKLTIPKRS